MSQIEITREEFERLWGYVPPGDAVGVDFYGAPVNDMRANPIAKYRFVGKTHDEIRELEKLSALGDPVPDTE